MEVWEALSIEKIMTVGRTCPLVVMCNGPQPENTERQPFLVKAMGLPEVIPTGLFNEIFGNYLARKVGVETAKPALIYLSPEFVEATQVPLSTAYKVSGKEVTLAAGYGVGCDYLSQGFIPLIPNGFLSENKIEQAIRIYGFDLMVQNIDRRFANPNCAHWGQRLIAYDFEMCFSFTLSLFNPYKAWQVAEHRLVRDHIFYNGLRSIEKDGKVDFSAFLEDVRALDVDECIGMARHLPESWTTHLPKVEEHLRDIVMNLSSFQKELHRSLS